MTSRENRFILSYNTRVRCQSNIDLLMIQQINWSNHMSNLPHCPKCNSEYTYEDQNLFVCPECAHEWSNQSSEEEKSVYELDVKDINGNQLHDGDAVTIIKDLKVKGSSNVLKVGTKVKNIRLIEGDHNIDCKIDGFGPMKLKSCFVKKISS